MRTIPSSLLAVLLGGLSAVPSVRAHPGQGPHTHPFTLEDSLLVLAAMALWAAWRAWRGNRLTK
ncbi:MAG TPA: hypothetical protein VEB66_12060 [Opitutaceae bacterium]|nr:hypothetical protein [Opitutaceae bacterium]